MTALERSELGYELSVGVCGAGVMGAGIAQAAAQAGHRVVVYDHDHAVLARARAGVSQYLDAAVRRGKFTEGKAREAEARLHWTSRLQDLASCVLIIEAIIESVTAKRSLLERIEQVVSPSALIASNTSSFSITALASALARPQRFLGLHFFNPAHVMKLVEVAPGDQTSPEVAASAVALMRAWGKAPILVKDAPGFIVNRAARPFYSEGWRALEEGAADAATIDFVYRDLGGFRMGPLELGDVIGHDVNAAAARSIHSALNGRARFALSRAQQDLVAAGRLGRKCGRGVYEYGADAPAYGPALALADQSAPCDGVWIGESLGRSAAWVAASEGKPAIVMDIATNDAATTLVFAASDARARAAAFNLAAQKGKRPIEIADRPGLIVLRTLLQLVNAAADIVDEAIATPEAVDLAMLNGVNYPFGLFAWAERFGWPRVVSALEAIAKETGDPIYEPSAYLRDLREGAR